MSSCQILPVVTLLLDILLIAFKIWFLQSSMEQILVFRLAGFLEADTDMEIHV